MNLVIWVYMITLYSDWVGPKKLTQIATAIQMNMIWFLDWGYNTSLAEDIVIAVASCMDGAYIGKMYLGAHNILQDEDTQVEVASHDFQIHENYDSNTMKSEFPSPVTFSKKLFQTK